MPSRCGVRRRPAVHARNRGRRLGHPTRTRPPRRSRRPAIPQTTTSGEHHGEDDDRSGHRALARRERRRHRVRTSRGPARRVVQRAARRAQPHPRRPPPPRAGGRVHGHGLRAGERGSRRLRGRAGTGDPEHHRGAGHRLGHRCAGARHHRAAPRARDRPGLRAAARDSRPARHPARTHQVGRAHRAPHRSDGADARRVSSAPVRSSAPGRHRVADGRARTRSRHRRHRGIARRGADRARRRRRRGCGEAPRRSLASGHRRRRRSPARRRRAARRGGDAASTGHLPPDGPRHPRRPAPPRGDPAGRGEALEASRCGRRGRHALQALPGRVGRGRARNGPHRCRPGADAPPGTPHHPDPRRREGRAGGAGRRAPPALRRAPFARRRGDGGQGGGAPRNAGKGGGADRVPRRPAGRAAGGRHLRRRDDPDGLRLPVRVPRACPAHVHLLGIPGHARGRLSDRPRSAGRLPGPRGALDQRRRRVHVQRAGTRHRRAAGSRGGRGGVRGRGLRQRQAHAGGSPRRPGHRLGAAQPGFRALRGELRCRGVRVDTPDALRDAVSAAWGRRVPTVVSVRVGRFPEPFDTVLPMAAVRPG